MPREHRLGGRPKGVMKVERKAVGGRPQQPEERGHRDQAEEGRLGSSCPTEGPCAEAVTRADGSPDRATGRRESDVGACLEPEDPSKIECIGRDVSDARIPLSMLKIFMRLGRFT